MISLAGIPVGAGRPLLVIAGPDVIESEAHALRHARLLREIAERHGLPYVFKCSYDKANRTSGNAFRGPGLVEGLRVLAKVKAEAKVPVLTDVHEVAQVAPVAEVVDILQVPAFLCRQTDLVVAVAFRAACTMSSGATNWPFFKLTPRPVLATATTRSVCRQRKAGICSTSTTSATRAHCAASCTSVRTGTPRLVRISAKIGSAASRPMPRLLLALVRLALSNEVL